MQPRDQPEQRPLEPKNGEAVWYRGWEVEYVSDGDPVWLAVHGVEGLASFTFDGVLDAIDDEMED